MKMTERENCMNMHINWPEGEIKYMNYVKMFMAKYPEKNSTLSDN